MEDLIERFIESESRTEADIQKRQSNIEIEKNKAQEIIKKAMERFGETWKCKGQDESDTGNNNKV